jgi:hypothetical protein
MKEATIESRQPKWRRRALLSGLIAALSASVFYLAGESISFILVITSFLVAGYLLIDAMMRIQLRAPFNTPLQLRLRVAETPFATGKFLILAALIGLLFAAAVFGIGYLLSP